MVQPNLIVLMSGKYLEIEHKLTIPTSGGNTQNLQFKDHC